jgi:hypothetical protein
MAGRALSVICVGDTILTQPDLDGLFSSTKRVLQSGDAVVAHIELPYTLRGEQSTSDVPGLGGDPKFLDPLSRVGFNVATLAHNHIFDFGRPGIEDMIVALKAQGIATAGAGLNIAEARMPAVIERKGRKVGVLSYNCVGPRESWATINKPGAAYVYTLTHYDLTHASPGGPPSKVYTLVDPDSQAAMIADIERLRPLVDVLIVALHKGIVHMPVKLPAYERQLAKAAIDAGADIIVSHHAHILRGVEVYKGKPIFHGLGNFAILSKGFDYIPGEPGSEERAVWAKRRKEIFGFEPDTDYPNYPFHPESKQTMIAACDVDEAGKVTAGFYPCWIKADAEVELLGNDERGHNVAAYVEKITREAGLSATFRWNGDRVLFE